MAQGAIIDFIDERRRRHGLSFAGPLKLRRAGEKEAFLLAILCAVDMYTTLWWVVRGEALEANPVLSWTFDRHPLLFVVVKSLLCLPALFFLTALAQRRPQFTVWLLRAAIVAYVGIYLLGVR